MKILLLVASALVLVSFVTADLPVHCPHHVNVGTWKMSMTQGNQDKSLSCAKPKEGQVCFYGGCFDNKVIGPPNFDVEKPEMLWTVSLADPNIAVATDDKGVKHKGTWTNIYDEGFSVIVAGRKFFAFSHFNDDGSQCDKTIPGWHSDAANPDAKKWGCYVANKISSDVQEDHIELLSLEEHKAHQAGVSSKKMVEEIPEPVKAYAPKNAHHDEMYQPEVELVQRINSKKSTWKAKIYPDFEKLTVGEFNLRAGFRPADLPDTPQRPEILLQEDISDLPDELDWRKGGSKGDGENYVDEVLSQECGSCFAVSTTSMISSRIRILTKNKVKVQIPYHQVLNCDRYNQGCAGGYPFLVEKYTQDFGLTKSGKCAATNPGAGAESLLQSGEEEPFVRMKDYGYIGGYYGGTTTAQMMKELHDNGPITVGISGGFELMHYEAGIFVQTGAYEEVKGGAGIRNDFEKVVHAVLLVGWAKDDSSCTGSSCNKHWIVKNSYGKHWGEDGYFRIPLGGDRDGVTSLASAGTPVLGGSNYFNLMAAAQEAGTAAEADSIVPES